MIRRALVLVQAGTFGPLAYIFTREGNWRLGVAQLFLAGVTALVYL